MKIKLPKLKAGVPNFLFLVIGLGIGVVVTLSLPNISRLTSIVFPSESLAEDENGQTEDRKRSLEATFREIIEAESNDDWDTLYGVVKPTDKEWLSVEDMALLYKKDKYLILSTEVIVHGVSVSGDTGSVDNTVIRCKTEKCTGEGKLEDRNDDKFVYIDGKWYRQSLKEPTEKARQIAAYIYADYKTREIDRKMLADKYGGGEDNPSKIIKTIATMLENDPEYLAYTEAWVEKDKAETSSANVNENSIEVVQSSNANPQVIKQPNLYNPVNCTTQTIGNFTYTDCY